METRDWRDMRERMVTLLERGGAGLDEWRARIAAAGDAARDEPALRAWLDGQGVRGYAQMLLVFETFGYPDFFTASADELVDAQYADREDLRPGRDRVRPGARSGGGAAL